LNSGIILYVLACDNWREYASNESIIAREPSFSYFSTSMPAFFSGHPAIRVVEITKFSSPQPYDAKVMTYTVFLNGMV
jgi:hypothetical protein